ncbi:hydroxymethylglutaryl-CoA lyase [Mytilinidion resinicola]|uniref:hydroxymethylglutaryl-CoA lyase n=1 Tax=Mytilinidion resinicola TaxID=574789 RepID=A0A6A6XYG5_9PEZI|nr:hydroxymethylglutaryl-CoA lyase [Mytilinidion resinicola]KAF2801318.1 hydroxymethylglutaryl-CoA lyase [Mytilinidion resinicola]
MSSRYTCLRLARLAARHPCRRSFATVTSGSAPRSSEHIRIVEVGPRDGLQNEKQSISLATKMQLIERLARTGLETIEAGSFVSPKWVPQMANSSEILQHILQSPPPSKIPITYQFLLPNIKGLDNFMTTYDSFNNSKSAEDSYPTPPNTPPAENTSSQDPNASSISPEQTPKIELSLFTAATESFTQKNTNCSIAESLKRFEPIMSRAKSLALPVRAYISVALGCPYEGPDTDPHRVAELAVSLLEMGADEISVGDTTGMGTAPKTAALLKVLKEAGVETKDLALHFHDTYGMALVNTVVALEHGVRTFDASVSGLGGCPYSPGATGNVATEDLVHLVNSLGASTGVDLEELSKVGEWISGELGRRNDANAGKAVLARLAKGR